MTVHREQIRQDAESRLAAYGSRTVGLTDRVSPELLARHCLTILAELALVVDALSVAADLLRGEGYDNDPDYRQEWQTITDALAAWESE